MECRLKYRCRNCNGVIFVEHLDWDGKLTFDEVLFKVINESLNDKKSSKMMFVHNCGSTRNTIFGIADLIGVCHG